MKYYHKISIDYDKQQLLDVANKYNCENFTLISTDKAVRPTNIMGATKRVSEMLCQMMAKDPKNKMSVCIVRFGNVLGSSGSVIPIFNEQIKKTNHLFWGRCYKFWS